MLGRGFSNTGGGRHKLRFWGHAFLTNGRPRSPGRVIGKGRQWRDGGGGRLVHSIFSPDFALVARPNPGKPLGQTMENRNKVAYNNEYDR
jgi:hypothetical protein